MRQADLVLTPADQIACDRIVVTQPVWNHFDTASNALDLDTHTLLHAGPAFNHISDICRPIMNSACVAAVYEGIAANFKQAENMINAQEISLQPAQDYGVVTPLAAVVSASMPLHGVYDAHRGQVRVFAPINGGSKPSLRLGLCTDAVLEHIRWLNGPFCDVLFHGMAEGIELIPLAVAGLEQGDDCHGRTAYATQLLIAELNQRTLGGIKDSDALAFMNTSPSLFLNLWMAATKCMMQVASGIEESAVITAAGGNGIDVGIQISGLPGQWFTHHADPPQGEFDIDLPIDRALGAIGDSAVIDSLGLGAMAIDQAPEQFKVLGVNLPINYSYRIERLKIANHPDFKSMGIKLGISARQVVDLGCAPMIALGILDCQGDKGRLGGGIYDMPLLPFTSALTTLETSS